MASVFQRGRSDVWIAKIRVWSAAAGKWRWLQKGTGTTDRGQAMTIAAGLERASGQAKAGVMTREKALRLVNDILDLAGCETVESTPTLEAVVRGILSADVSDGTARKYKSQWKALREWAGEKAGRPVDAWTAQDGADYYEALKKRHSATTANDHLRFLSMIFERAVRLGHRANNPIAALDRARNDSVERETFTRGQTAAVLRACRRGKRRDWCALVALGWHTGHRIQDLLDVTKERMNGDLVTIRPRKKGGYGRAIVLPIPRWLARMVARMGDFRTIHKADNRAGRVSDEFIGWMRAAGVDPLPVVRGKRTTHRRSFHSFRHSMASRLVAAGVTSDLARLVTDHESEAVRKRYVHAEIEALRTAMTLAKRK